MIRTGLGISAAILSAMAGVALWAERTIPADARVALQYGLDGEPTRFGDKSEAVFGLWLLIGVGALMTALFVALSQTDPRKKALARSRKTFLFAWCSSLLMLLVVNIAMALSLTGVEQDPELSMRAIFGALGMLIMVLGNAMGKVRPNFTLGVRTPWTLSSDIAWDKTHRLSGLLMVVWGGALLASAGLAPAAYGVAIAAGGGLALAVVSIVASYLYWREAPDKRTA
jgi:hypothetical protein